MANSDTASAIFSITHHIGLGPLSHFVQIGDVEHPETNISRSGPLTSVVHKTSCGKELWFTMLDPSLSRPFYKCPQVLEGNNDIGSTHFCSCNAFVGTVHSPWTSKATCWVHYCTLYFQNAHIVNAKVEETNACGCEQHPPSPHWYKGSFMPSAEFF